MKTRRKTVKRGGGLVNRVRSVFRGSSSKVVPNSPIAINQKNQLLMNQNKNYRNKINNNNPTSLSPSVSVEEASNEPVAPTPLKRITATRVKRVVPQEESAIFVHANTNIPNARQYTTPLAVANRAILRNVKNPNIGRATLNNKYKRNMRPSVTRKRR